MSESSANDKGKRKAIELKAYERSLALEAARKHAERIREEKIAPYRGREPQSWEPEAV